MAGHVRPELRALPFGMVQALQVVSGRPGRSKRV